MIEIKLLGGAKKALGLDKISINEESLTLEEILNSLKKKSENSHVFNKNNMIISINGIDSSVYDGSKTMVKSGDSLTVVTIVHGG